MDEVDLTCQQMNSSSSSASIKIEESIQVFVRIRPELIENISSSLNRSIETATTAPSSSSPSCLSVMPDGCTIRLTQPCPTNRKAVAAIDDKLYTFSRVFNDKSTQDDVYDHVNALVRATVNGYNTTIFAYGSTGSGKSYTMTGNSSDPGIIPRAISDIFSIIETTTSEENDVFFYVRLSYVELYNNNFRNLIEFASKELSSRESDVVSEQDSNNLSLSNRILVSPSSTNISRSEKIEVRESQTAGVFLAGPSIRIPVTSATDAFKLINRGNKYRAVGSTQCNNLSSRSHAILTLHVESKIVSNATHNLSSTPELRLGKMHLVDLAGSERITMSGVEGDSLVETQNINLSLTALGDVLSALSKNAMVLSQQQHRAVSGKLFSKTIPALVTVPYRNSKLTHLLKDSLGGNSKTIMVATIRQGGDYFQQTSVSLMYASRAKKIKNHSVVNRNVIGDTGIHAVSSEIDRLRGRLDERTNEFERLRILQLQDAKENHNLKSRLQELNHANESEKRQLEQQMSHIIHSQAGQLASQRQKISSLQKALQDELAISQNRIAEQEKEIKWLKKALEDSAQDAKQPKEQLEKMQRVLDGWQGQAESTQRELIDSVKLVEDLRSRTTTLSSDLKTSKSMQQQLQDELTELSQSYNASCVKSEQLSTMNFSSEQVIKQLQLELSAKTELCKELQENLHTFHKRLEDSSSAFNYESKQVEMLKTEKSELAQRLSSVLGTLEQQTSKTLSETAHQLKDVDQKRKIAEEKLISATVELETLRNAIGTIHYETAELIKEKNFELSKAMDALNAEKETSINLTKKFTDLVGDYETTALLLQQNKSTVAELELRNTSLISQSKDHLMALQSEHTKIIQDLFESRCRHEDDITKQYNLDLQALQDIHSIELERLKSECSIESAQTELQDKITSLQQEIFHLSNEHAQAMQENAKAFDIYRLQSNGNLESMKNQHERSLAEMKIRLDAEWTNRMGDQMDESLSSHLQSFRELEGKFDYERDIFVQKETRLLEELNQLERRHKENLADLTTLLKESEKKADIKLADTKAKYKDKFKSALALQKSTFDAAKDDELRALHEHYQLELQRSLDEQCMKFIDEQYNVRVEVECQMKKLFTNQVQEVSRKMEDQIMLTQASLQEKELQLESVQVQIRDILSKSRIELNRKTEEFTSIVNELNKEKDSSKKLGDDYHSLLNVLEDKEAMMNELEAINKSLILEMKESKESLKLLRSELEETRRVEVEKVHEDLEKATLDLRNVKIELNYVITEKENKISILEDEIVSIKKCSADEITLALELQLAQVLEQHKREYDLLRNDKEVIIANYERELSVTKEASETKAELLRAQLDTNTSRLVEQSRLVEDDLKMKLEEAMKLLADKEDLVDSLSKETDGTTLSLLECQTRHSKEIRDMHSTHDETLIHMKSELCSHFEQQISDMKQSYTLQLQQVSLQYKETFARDLAREVQETEERCSQLFDLKLESVHAAHAREKEVINRQCKLQMISLTDSSNLKLEEMTSRIEDLERVILENNQQHVQKLNEVLAVKDSLLNEAFKISQDDLKEVEKTFTKDIEDLKSSHAIQLTSAEEDWKKREVTMLEKVTNDVVKAQELLRDQALLHLQRQLDETNSAREKNLMEEHESQLLVFKSEISNLRSRHDEDIQLLQERNKAEIYELIRRDEESKHVLGDVQEQHRLALESLIQAHNEAVLLLRRDSAVELNDAEEQVRRSFLKIDQLEKDIQHALLDLETANLLIQEREMSHSKEISRVSTEFEAILVNERESIMSSHEETLKRALLSQSGDFSATHNADLESLRGEMMEITTRYKSLLAKAEEKFLSSESSARDLAESNELARNAHSSVKMQLEETIKSMTIDHLKEVSSLRTASELKINELIVTHTSELECTLKSKDVVITTLKEENKHLLEVSQSERQKHLKEISELRSFFESEKLSLEIDVKLNTVQTLDAERLRLQATLNEEIESLRKAATDAEADAARVTALSDELSELRSANEELKNELEISKQNVLHGPLRTQYEELYYSYLQLLQQQAKGGNEEHKQSPTGVKLADDSPSDLWRRAIRTEGVSLLEITPEPSRIPSSPFMPTPWDAHRTPSTPLHLLRMPRANAAAAGERDKEKYRQLQQVVDSDTDRGVRPTHLPWSSPALRSSPTDQLIAAILDGDVQGIRAVVKSKGAGLTSTFWKDLAKSILPLHRAISGLHFHGNEKLLLNSIEALTALGADLTSVDAAGNTVLHKALLVCTSTNVVSVVNQLIRIGCVVGFQNKDGETPLHLECKRLRTASPTIIDMLLKSDKTGSLSGGKTSLITIILLKAVDTIVKGEQDRGFNWVPDSSADGESQNKLRSVWIPVVSELINAGIQWDAQTVTPKKESQLHLLLQAFPPPREQIQKYAQLVDHALEAGLSPLLEDEKGGNCIFTFCEVMSHNERDKYPECQAILASLLRRCGSSGPGNSDRFGRTVFDIEETVPDSCLSSCKRLLLSFNTEQVTPIDRKMQSVMLVDAKWSGFKAKLKRSSGQLGIKKFMPVATDRESDDENIVNATVKATKNYPYF